MENADLFQDHSGDFLKGVKEATSAQFFPRFTLKLGGLLDSNIDLDHSFTTKRYIIAEAFTQALGKDSAVKRLSAFHAQGLTSFSGKPMEQIINHVDIHVSKMFGTTNDVFTDEDDIVQTPINLKRSTKYFMIFQICNDLPVELKQI